MRGLSPRTDRLPAFEAYEWRVRAARPAGRNRAKAQSALNAGFASPEVQSRFAQLNIVSRPNTPEEFHKFVEEQMTLWSGVVKEEDQAGVRLGLSQSRHPSG